MSIFEQKTEDEIWLEYKKTHSRDIRDAIVKQYMPLVKYVAGKLSVGLPSCVDYDDLVSFGQMGLLDAVNKFDVARGIKFKTYAVTRIRGAILDELRQLDWVPRSIRQKSKEIDMTIASLEARLGRPASDEEIAMEMGESVEEYQQDLQKVAGTSIMSLNDVWTAGEDGETPSIVDTIESPKSLNPDVMTERKSIQKIIINAINELPEKEKYVILFYHYEDATFKEIGLALGVSESRVSQLHSSATRRLRAKLTNIRKGII